MLGSLIGFAVRTAARAAVRSAAGAALGAGVAFAVRGLRERPFEQEREERGERDTDRAAGTPRPRGGARCRAGTRTTGGASDTGDPSVVVTGTESVASGADLMSEPMPDPLTERAADTSSGTDTGGKTHFGYRTVDRAAKAGLVGEVFDSVAPSYDVMNDLMSFGIHRLWKRFTIEQSAVRPGQRVLDIAGGTGDLAGKLARRVGSGGHVLLADINAAMLHAGRERLVDLGVVGNVHYVQSDAEALPFTDDTFDCVTIAFGLRNVTDKARALASMRRVLKPGGRLLVLEFSKPVLPVLARAYDTYSFTALPLMGRLVANDAESYRYLAESIRVHPDQETLAGMMRETGLEHVTYHNLTGGIVALHKGFKF